MKDWKIFAGPEQNSTIPDSNTLQPAATTVVPVVQEDLLIGKRQVETGKIQIAKTVNTEQVNTQIPVMQEDLVVETKTLNQYISIPPPGVRQEGETTIVSVVKEIVIKQLVLVEEIHITKRRTETTAHVQETLRKEEVIINRTGNL